jgi:hypothetical protein
MLKPLPTTTPTFKDIIEGGFLYVDKTQYLYELVRYTKGVYFLARPRRFGKSLMVSTLEQIFKGNRDLFRGLWIDGSDYNWNVHPVIRFDFSRNTVNSAAKLEQLIDYYVEEIALEHGLTLRGFDYQSRFDNLIRQLGQKSQVVILIDEYDKPILDNIEQIAEAIRIRDVLKAFYTVIKAMDASIRLVFITGISKFSRVGVFSAMNNLEDISLRPTFAAALGITEVELQHYFQAYLAAFAQANGLTETVVGQRMRYWYNGFCFARNAVNVYNPYSTLLFFKEQGFANFWFESGTPTFLIKLIRDRGYEIAQLTQLDVAEIDFSSYEIESLAIVPLLFQTGYLTIKGTYQQQENLIYRLDYPNYEVEHAFITYLLSEFSNLERTFARGHLQQLVRSLESRNLAQFFTTLDSFFANIDYDLHLKQEKYYQTIFYLIFLMIGMQVSAEVKTGQGRIDAVIELADQIFLFEFKLDKDAESALQQIKDNAYHQKYALKGKPITLVGANFDSNQRKITGWKSDPNSGS